MFVPPPPPPPTLEPDRELYSKSVEFQFKMENPLIRNIQFILPIKQHHLENISHNTTIR